MKSENFPLENMGSRVVCAQQAIGEFLQSIENFGVVLATERRDQIQNVMLTMTERVLSSKESLIMGDFWQVFSLLHVRNYHSDYQFVTLGLETSSQLSCNLALTQIVRCNLCSSSTGNSSLTVRNSWILVNLRLKPGFTIISTLLLKGILLSPDS